MARNPERAVGAATSYTTAMRIALSLLALVGCGHPIETGDGPYVDHRAPNPTCLAPDRLLTDASVVLERAFDDREFSRPVGLYPSLAGDDRWYVIQQSGELYRFVEGDAAAAELVADFPDSYHGSSEQGLLGLAFHPQFVDNGVAFASYTAMDGSQLVSRIVRVVSGDGGASFDTDSVELIVQIDQPYSNHNGGNIAFGPDGFLYAGYGDGGSGGDPAGNGQNRDVLLGKMLRIDIDGGLPYDIPADNPFADGGGAPEVYAWGLRNPWRWFFDPANGELWAGDVGQNVWEEFDLIERGGNYGWDVMEGLDCYPLSADCDPAGLILPLAQYGREAGEKASITGGPVYRGTRIPGLVGVPLFADIYSGTLYGLVPDVKTGERVIQALLPESGVPFVSFGQAPDGEVYAVAYSGEIYALAPAGEVATDAFPARLSETGCVDPDDATAMVDAMLPYDVNMALWSDDAEKGRWFAIPDGTTAEVGENGTLVLPIGSVVVKEFRLGDQRVETRLLVRHADGEWAGYSYAWNDAQTDAELLPAGASRVWAGQDWQYPSRSQCLGCHTSASDRLLGLTLAQLDREATYPWGETLNQLDRLARIDVLEGGAGAVEPLPTLDGGNPVEARARAYLAVNCAHCHQPGGTGLGAMDLRYSVAMADTRLCAAVPEHGLLGLDAPLLVDPGRPENSILSLRMHATDANRMPAYGTELVDADGTSVVDAWITAMEACP